MATDTAPLKNVLASERWIVLGSDAANSIIARGGPNPVAIHAQAGDAKILADLVADANEGRIAMENKTAFKDPAFVPKSKND